MSKKIDKFAVFSKKFVQLDTEGQDKLVKIVYELLKTHQSIKDPDPFPLFDDGMTAPIMPGFKAEINKIC